MKKPTTRKERIEFIIQKKGRHVADIFILMTDKEVKSFFDAIYTTIKNAPDVTDQCH